MSLTLRPAGPDDAGVIHGFIVELATYEHAPDAVEVTPATLREQLASPTPPFECVLAELAGRPVGFAVFFPNYSTWRGRRGLYLEDLFVTERARGRGIGRALLRHVCRLARERGCARVEWAVLDWNAPAIGFYRSLGAIALDEWTVYRLTDRALARMAE